MTVICVRCKQVWDMDFEPTACKCLDDGEWYLDIPEPKEAET